jgi:hypothetical protein
MYKTIITTAAATGLLLVTAAASAGPYIGLGYQAGQTRIEDKDLRDPVVDGQAIDTDNKWKASPRALLGYQFNDNWALEFSYSRAGIENSVEDRTDPAQDEEWESEITGNHFTLAPVYLHPLGDLATLRVSAGVVYGDYKVRQLHALDVENGPDVTLSRIRDKESSLGGLVGLGAAFHLPWKIDLVTEVQYQRTKTLSNAGVSATAVYRF